MLGIVYYSRFEKRHWRKRFRTLICSRLPVFCVLRLSVEALHYVFDHGPHAGHGFVVHPLPRGMYVEDFGADADGVETQNPLSEHAE